MNPQPDQRSAFQRILAAEARAARDRLRTGGLGFIGPYEVSSELFRVMPSRPAVVPPAHHSRIMPGALKAVGRWFGGFANSVAIAVAGGVIAGVLLLYLTRHG